MPVNRWAIKNYYEKFHIKIYVFDRRILNVWLNFLFLQFFGSIFLCVLCILLLLKSLDCFIESQKHQNQVSNFQYYKKWWCLSGESDENVFSIEITVP